MMTFEGGLAAIEGNIGGGKSSLAKALEALGAVVVHEPIERSEYFRRFCVKPGVFAEAFQAEMLLARAEDAVATIRTVRDGGVPRVIVFDRSFPYDLVFMLLNFRVGRISQAFHDAYMALVDLLRPYMPAIVDVLHLDVDPATCIARIRKRGRPGEVKSLTQEYLEGVDSAYDAAHEINLAHGAHVVHVDWDPPRERGEVASYAAALYARIEPRTPPPLVDDIELHLDKLRAFYQCAVGRIDPAVLAETDHIIATTSA